MKRIIFLFYWLVFPICMMGQFHATYNGFRTSDDKDYLVLSYDQVSAHKLYLLTSKWINRTQYNPNIYTKNIEDETIYIHSGDTIKLPGLIKTIVNIDYGLNFEFKDGRVRFLPIIHTIRVPQYLYFGYEDKKNNLNNLVLFKSDGSYRGKNGKAFSKVIDDWLNKIVNEYDKFMKSSGGEDEW